MRQRSAFDNSDNRNNEEKSYAHADRNGKQSRVNFLLDLRSENGEVGFGDCDKYAHNEAHAD